MDAFDTKSVVTRSMPEVGQVKVSSLQNNNDDPDVI